MPVENSKKSLARREANSVRRLERGAVRPSGTQEERMSYDGKTLNVILVYMIQGLCSEVLSRDVWFLAMSRAKTLCKHAGIPEEAFMKAQSIVFEMHKDGFKSNPMSTMF